MENPNFLKQKYNLHNSEEVEVAALRTSPVPEYKIFTYLYYYASLINN